MAKPKTKAELIEAATTNYENLLEMIANRTEEEKSREYDFSDDDRKKKRIGKETGICATF